MFIEIIFANHPLLAALAGGTITMSTLGSVILKENPMAITTIVLAAVAVAVCSYFQAKSRKT